MYSVMVAQCKISPSEFWQMTPNEVMEIVEHYRPKTVNGIEEDDIDNMMARRNQLTNEGIKVL